MQHHRIEAPVHPILAATLSYQAALLCAPHLQVFSLPLSLGLIAVVAAIVIGGAGKNELRPVVVPIVRGDGFPR